MSFPGRRTAAREHVAKAGPDAVGREALGLIYLLYMVMSAGSGYLSMAIALNALSLHARCTVIFVVVGAIIVCTFWSDTSNKS